MVCTLPVLIRIRVNMDYLPSWPLGIRILIQCTLGAYPIGQILVFSTLSDPLEKLYNESIYNHYGVVLEKSQLSYVIGLISASKVIGMIFCLLFLYPMLDTIGRKKMAVYAPFILGGCLGSVCQILSKLLVSVELFLLAELFIGAAFPIMNYASIRYLSECAPTRIRGATTLILSCSGVTAWVSMSFIAKPYLLGNSDYWHFIPVIHSICAIAHFCITVPYPESPKCLLQKEKRIEAERAVRIFHGQGVDVEEVLNDFNREMHHSVDEKITIRKVFQSPLYRESFLCVFLFDIANQISPAIIDVNYNIKIRKSFGFTIDEIMNLRIISAFAFLPFFFVGAIMVEKFGRRFVMYSGGLLSFLIAFSLCFGQFFVGTNDVGTITIITGYAVTVFVNLFTNCGFGNMSLLMVSELCVPNIRTTVAQASALVCMVCQLILFATYPPLLSFLGGWYYIPMMIFIVIVFTILSRRLPETSRISVERIITDMEGRSRNGTSIHHDDERDPLLDRRRDSNDLY